MIYAAKSTEDVHASIPTQIETCRSRAEAEGRTVVAVYKDEAKSAYSSNRGADLAAARSHAEALASEHGAAEIWVVHTDRLARGDGRKTDHLTDIVLWSFKVGVTVRSIEDPDAGLDLLHAVVNGQRNHEDSKRKSASTKAGKRRRFENGQPGGGPINDGYRLVPVLAADGTVQTASDGRAVQRRELDPARAPLVARIFDLVEQGHSNGDVMRLLNAERAVTRRGYAWTTRAVRDIVTNGYYAGLVTMNGETREGTHPPLIERDRWERIEAARTRLDPSTLQRRKGGRRPKREFILRNAAFCTRCGATMYTRDDQAPAYVCRNRRERTGLCDAPPVSADRLEAGVVARIDDLIPDLEQWIATKVTASNEERDRFAAALAREKAALRDAERLADQMRVEWRRHLASGSGLADTVLREVVKADHDVADQRGAIEAADARLSEWTTSISTHDAALEFFTEIRDVVVGRVRTATSAMAVRAALAEVLAGVWAELLDDGSLSVRVVLRDAQGAAPSDLAMVLRPAATDGGETWPWAMADTLAARELEIARHIEADANMTAREKTRRDAFVSRPVWSGIELPPLILASGRPTASAGRSQNDDGRAGTRPSPEVVPNRSKGAA